MPVAGLRCNLVFSLKGLSLEVSGRPNRRCHIGRPVPGSIVGKRACSGQLIPDTTLSFSSATAGAIKSPRLSANIQPAPMPFSEQRTIDSCVVVRYPNCPWRLARLASLQFSKFSEKIYRVVLTCPENFVPKKSRDNGSSAQMRSWYEEKSVQRRTLRHQPELFSIR